MTPCALASHPPVVVQGGAWNALAIIRSVGRLGVPVYCLLDEGVEDFAGASRFAKPVVVPNALADPDAALEALLGLGASCAEKPVLLFTNDTWLQLAGEHEDRVRERFLLPQSPWPLMERILNKRSLYRMAREAGIAVPETWEFDSIGDLVADAEAVRFPCVVKPECTVNYIERIPKVGERLTRHRTSLHDSVDGLKQWASAMIEAGVDVPVVVQRWIPGTAETLYTLTSYSDVAGRMVAGSVGHKVRQFPPDAGCIEVGRLRYEPQVFEQGRRLLDAIGFHGLANTEFKYDARDGSYRLMEINPRLGKWNGSALAAGLNLPAIAYRDVLGCPYEGPVTSTSADGAQWVDMWSDAVNCLYRYRLCGYDWAHLGLVRWLWSMRGRRIGAVWSWRDPRPGLVYFGQRLRMFLRHAWRRLRRRRSSP